MKKIFLITFIMCLGLLSSCFSAVSINVTNESGANRTVTVKVKTSDEVIGEQMIENGATKTFSSASKNEDTPVFVIDERGSKASSKMKVSAPVTVTIE
jgi:hypothetical protein